VTAPAEAFPALSQVELERRRYREGQSRRSGLLAAASTVVFLSVMAAAVLLSPGWSRVREQFFDVSYGWEVLPDILRGLWLNVRVLAVSAVAVLGLGLLIASARTLRGPVFFPVRLLAAAYTDLFRGIPLIILLYLIGFGVPGLRLEGVPTNEVVLGTIALVLCYSAYVAEVFRAGIESVHPSQRAAARSLGLTYGQTMRKVVLPQAVRRVQPALLNDFVAMQKDVGLISILGAVDAVRAAQIEVAQSFNFTPYVVAGLLFVLLAIPSARLADWVQLRSIRRQQAGGTA
jgi:polar amino acid transport system permease protein